MRKKIIIGNWKMNPETGDEAALWWKDIAKSIKDIKKVEVAICAPYLYSERLYKLSQGASGGRKKIALGAQDAFSEAIGPFTGEISPDMLRATGVKYVILGHSERRALGEDNLSISKKIKASLRAGLTPVLCIGETERDHKHQYFEVIKTQIKECLNGIAKNLIAKIIFAYEPVWSISSTPGHRDATAADSREMSVYIRKLLSDLGMPDIASEARILYGGSANEKDAFDFLLEGGVDGLLPGRASLDPRKFSEMIRIAESLS